MANDKLVDFDHVTDYISREKISMHLSDLQYGEAPTGREGENIDYQNGVYAGFDMAYVALKRFPAADVVEVVRCRDCIHAGDSDCPIDWPKNGEDYCSFGERSADMGRERRNIP